MDLDGGKLSATSVFLKPFTPHTTSEYNSNIKLSKEHSYDFTTMFKIQFNYNNLINLNEKGDKSCEQWDCYNHGDF